MHWFLGILAFLALLLPSQAFNPREKRQAMPNVDKWDDGQLNFYYDQNIKFEFMAMFRDAIDYLQKHTCIKLKYDPNQESRYKVRIENGNTCSAHFGQSNSKLTFAHHCAGFGVAVHELMHALGIAHTQSRDDRDEYLVVDSGDYNDEKEPETYNPVPFDYGSIMMYEMNPVRYPRDPEYNYTMGNLRVAFYDMILLNTFYNCTCDGFPELKCQNGGIVNPATCESCSCTDGFKGVLCDEIDGTHLEATTEWQFSGVYPSRRIGGIPENTVPHAVNFGVTAPPNSTIQIQLTKLDGFFCQTTCDYNGVEVKFKEDRRITSPLVCCDDDDLWNKTRSSTNNPFIIVKYGSPKGPGLQFRYRYLPGNGTVVEEAKDNKLDKE